VAKIRLMGNIEGYSSAKSPRNTPVNFCTHMKNMYVRNGELRKRKGMHKQQSIGFDIGNIVRDGFAEYNDGGTREIIWADANNNWSHSSDFGGTASLTVTSGTTLTRFKKLNNLIYIACGDKMRKYGGGTSIYDSGLPPPGIFANIVLNAGTGLWKGLFSVQYDWAAVWISDNDSKGPTIESNIAGTPSSVTPLAGGSGTDTVTLTRPALSSVDTEHNVTHWRVYRRLNIIGGLFFRVSTTDIPIAETTFVDDGTLANFQLAGPTNHTEPTAADDLEYWKSRMWYIDADDKEKVRFSLLDFAEYVPSINVFVVGSQNDPCKKLIGFDQFILIIKKDSVWAIEGNSLLSFRLREVLRDNGTISEAMRYEQFVYWHNAKGIWQWNSNTKQLVNIALQIWNDFKTMTVANIKMAFEPEEGHIWFGESSSSIFYIFDPSIERFIGKYTTPAAVNLANFGFMDDITDPKVLSWGDGIGLYTYNFSGVSDETQFDAELFLGMDYGQEQDIIIRNIKIYDEQGITATTTETIAVHTMTPNQTPSTSDDKGDVTFNNWNKNEFGINEQSPHISVGLKIANSQIDRDWRISGFELDVEDRIGVR